MTYAQFLVLFLGIPLFGLAAIARWWLDRRVALTLAGVVVLAVLYTGPWDDAIIRNGVWSYGSGRVWGLLIGHVPLEEYAFYILQVVLSGGITALLLRKLRT